MHPEIQGKNNQIKSNKRTITHLNTDLSLTRQPLKLQKRLVQQAAARASKLTLPKAIAIFLFDNLPPRPKFPINIPNK